MSVELRGEWPGGIKTDPETGHAQFEVDPGKVAAREGHEVVRPVWACRLCARKLKHTEAEHQAFTGGASNGGLSTRGESSDP